MPKPTGGKKKGMKPAIPPKQYEQKTSSTRSDAGKIRRSPGSRRC
jgi:hypothetical protein